MRTDNTRITCALAAALGLGFAAVPALAQETTSKIDGGDTAWMISATALVLMMTFPIITVALIAGAVADRMRFSAFLWFCAAWLIFVYVPIAHWVWGGGFLANAGVLDFAGGTVVHLNAGIAGLVAAYVIGKRHGYGTENFAPHDLSLAVIGTGLLWVGLFGFNR